MTTPIAQRILPREFQDSSSVFSLQGNFSGGFLQMHMTYLLLRLKRAQICNISPHGKRSSVIQPRSTSTQNPGILRTLGNLIQWVTHILVLRVFPLPPHVFKIGLSTRTALLAFAAVYKSYEIPAEQIGIRKNRAALA